MKKVFKKILAIIMTLLSMFLICSSNAFATQLEDDIEKFRMEPGEILEIGSYPQTEVTDSQIVSKLNGLQKNWKSYNYPKGEAIAEGDWMKYCDVSMDGEKYRGVYFSQYRPYYTNELSCDETGDFNEAANCQYLNGYYKNMVYWFKYEPIRWIVLESKCKGYRGKSVVVTLTTEKILDSQPFDTKLFMDDNYDYYRDINCTDPYEYSYVDSNYRNFLMNDFLNGAFNESEKNIISCETNYMLSGGVILTDKLMIHTNFSFSDESKHFMAASGTNYAKVQGLSVGENGKSPYWILGVGDTYYPGGEATCRVINETGKEFYFGIKVNNNRCGVRPVTEVIVLDAAEYCEYCEKRHTDGFLEKIVEFFHKIFYWFQLLFGIRT